MRFHPLLPAALLSVVLASCASRAPSEQAGMHGGHMMNVDTTVKAASRNVDLSDLPLALPAQKLEIADSQTVELKASAAKMLVGGSEVPMVVYNGQFPGPTLHASQGTTFTVNFTNDTEWPTTVHWHGLRLANANDGVPGVTQAAVQPGESYAYTVAVPDEGTYWYHPHVREDVQQDMGLYGAIVVSRANPDAAEPEHRETLILDDMLLQDGKPVPYGEQTANFSLMGRFGTRMLVNGSDSYVLDAVESKIVRVGLLNAASVRPFRVTVPGAKLKLVGLDSGSVEKQRFVDSVTLHPGERATVDVLVEKAGEYPILNDTPAGSTRIGTIRAAARTQGIASDAKAFAVLAQDSDLMTGIRDMKRQLKTTAPAHTLHFTMEMGGMNHGGMQGQMMMNHASPDGIEWEDTMGMMNAMSSGNLKWKIVDESTKKANMDIHLTHALGEPFVMRLINDERSMHPMQHPFHIHGVRFLVLSDNGKAPADTGWKDTVSVAAGHTVDILVDSSNPGDWMFHCHIAEHLTNGMMGMLSIQ